MRFFEEKKSFFANTMVGLKYNLFIYKCKEYISQRKASPYMYTTPKTEAASYFLKSSLAPQ